MGLENVGIKIVQKVLTFTERPSAENGLSRLKDFFRKSQNYKTYDYIVGTCKRPILGNIPDELIKVIVETNPVNKAEIIKGVQQAFAKSADTLKLCQIGQLDAIKNISGYDKEMRFLYEMLMKGTYTKIPQSKEELEIIKLASQELERDLKSLLSNGAKVNIEFVGEGCFKNCYKLQIFDSNGKAIMHDRAFNVFKDIDLSGKIVEAKYQKAQDLLQKYSDEEILAWMDSQNIRELSMFKVASRRKIVQRCASGARGSDRTGFMLKNSCKHGAKAEANSVERLKHILGHNISRSNAVDTDMFDLQNGFHLAQYSDDALPKITHEINFERLGLKAEDLHAENLINDRIVDFGDIEINRELLADNTTLSFYRKIMNRQNIKERNAVLERYKKLVENPRTPLRNKLQDAIKAAEEDIARETKIKKSLCITI